MEIMVKIIEILEKSIEALRWPSLTVFVISVILFSIKGDYSDLFPPSFFANKEHLAWLVIVIISSGITFIFGWLSVGLRLALRPYKAAAIRRSGIEATRQTKKLARRQRQAEERLRLNRNRQAAKILSENQLRIVILALRSPDYTLAVKNDSNDMGTATMLVRRNVLILIRTWYSPDSFVIGEIFALTDWIIEIKDGILPTPV